jgi:hypothetical protein
LDAGEINRVVDSVGAALAYAHRQGILHRDIKPSNVLIQKDGRMYLADFGLARIAQAGESTLSSDAIMGTPQYISPEQARGDKDLDEGTDIYSFGVMLYEMVVGQVPFSADTPFSIIHDHIYTPLPIPRSVNENVPESVELVLLKTLSKERTDRYENIPAMVSAFKTAWEAAGIPMQGTALTLPAASEKPVNKEDKTKIPEEAKTAIGKETRKKRSPWLFISAAIILTISCVFVFLALRGIRNRRLAAQEQESVSSQVLDVPPELEPARPGPEQPLAEFDEPPLEVQEAQRIADENPEDPVAQLELALAFWDAGMQRPAYESLNHAADMAAENVDFLIEAGDQFHMRQTWIASAAMYLRAQKRIGDRRDVPEEVIMNFHEAVYMAAPNPELESTFPLIDEIMRIDQPIGLVAQARHAFHNGKIDEAHELLNQVNRLVPDMFEAKLLEAEMAVIEERFEAVNLLLQPLMADTGAPEWIRVMAEDLHNRIP